APAAPDIDLPMEPNIEVIEAAAEPVLATVVEPAPELESEAVTVDFAVPAESAALPIAPDFVLDLEEAAPAPLAPVGPLAAPEVLVLDDVVADAQLQLSGEHALDFSELPTELTLDDEVSTT
ncbi:hypothetical protein DBR42_26460, partial [Pelomonas sp. HMWF004]